MAKQWMKKANIWICKINGNVISSHVHVDNQIRIFNYITSCRLPVPNCSCDIVMLVHGTPWSEKGEWQGAWSSLKGLGSDKFWQGENLRNLHIQVFAFHILLQIATWKILGFIRNGIDIWIYFSYKFSNRLLHQIKVSCSTRISYFQMYNVSSYIIVRIIVLFTASLWKFLWLSFRCYDATSSNVQK